MRRSIFLHAIHRYALQEAVDLPVNGLIPYEGFEDLLERRYEQAIAAFLLAEKKEGANSGIATLSPTCMNKSPIKRSPTKCADRCEAAEAIAGCFASARPMNIR